MCLDLSVGAKSLVLNYGPVAFDLDLPQALALEIAGIIICVNGPEFELMQVAHQDHVDRDAL